jgi:drug/metabolite transporter (DMT)-like permease
MAICFAGMNLSYLMAVTLTTPANAIWLQSAAPWWVCVISLALFGQPVVRRDLVPLVFGMLGVGTILGFELFHAPDHNAVGLLCAVASGITYAGVVVAMGRLRTENAAWMIALNHAVAAAVLLPWMFYLGRWPSAGQFLVLAAFGALQMGVPYVLLARGLRAISAQEAVAIGLIEPVLVPVWVYLVWGVEASWWTAAGASLILTGLVLRYVVIEWLANRGVRTPL